MERQSNSRSCRGRSRQSKKKKRLYYRAVCIAIYLLITAEIFGIVSLLRESKGLDSSAGGEMAKSAGGFYQVDDGQGGTALTSDQADPISVTITAANAVVMNADTNLVLYQKAGSDKIAPASTAKMLTALTVLDYCSPKDEITVGSEIEMIHADSSRAWLYQGDTMTVRQLLIALMLPSGNDAAYTFAVHTGKKIAGDGSMTNEQAIEVFMDKVNEKAGALGARDSNFVVPDGYDAEGQYTTACDLAIIAKACLENPCMAEIVASNTSSEKWANGREVTYNNTNELLNPSSPYYRSEVIGIKTGTSSLGGACVISAAVINGETYICVVMGSTEDARFQDSILIYDEIRAQ